MINEDGSHVIAHLSNDGVMTAIIMTNDESYFIEVNKTSHDLSHDVICFPTFVFLHKAFR